MAVTSIWAVHRSIKDALDYAANPEKTENPNDEDLKHLMDYAENPDKTEQRYLISGVNCLEMSIKVQSKNALNNENSEKRIYF